MIDTSKRKVGCFHFETKYHNKGASCVRICAVGQSVPKQKGDPPSDGDLLDNKHFQLNYQ